MYLRVTDVINNMARSETALIVVTSISVGGYSVSFDERTLAISPAFNFGLVIGLALFPGSLQTKDDKETREFSFLVGVGHMSAQLIRT